jgi:hypothetical protein
MANFGERIPGIRIDRSTGKSDSTFGLTKDSPSFGFSMGPGAGGDPGDIINCDPGNTPPTTLPTFGIPGGGRWPMWVVWNGCTVLSIMALNKRIHGKKIGEKKMPKGTPPMVGPENMKALRDCLLKRPPAPPFRGPIDLERNGLPLPVMPDLMYCKEHLMNATYGEPVDLSGFRTPANPYVPSGSPECPIYCPPPANADTSNCPPLCEKQIVNIAYSIRFRSYYKKEGKVVGATNLSGFGKEYRTLKNPPTCMLEDGSMVLEINHATTCEVVSCKSEGKGGGACFVCEDTYPQSKGISEICVNKEGVVSSKQNKLKGPEGKLRNEGKPIGGAGSCANTTATKGYPCLEMVPEGLNCPTRVRKTRKNKIDYIIVESECPKEKEEGK